MTLELHVTKPHRAKARLRSPALGVKANDRRLVGRQVGTPFQLGDLQDPPEGFGVDRPGGMEKTSLISLTSDKGELDHTWSRIW
jgi:hypothetical protein